MCLAVLIYLLGCFEHLEDALFRYCRSEDDGEVHERSHALAYGVLECLYHRLVLVLHEVPFVHDHYERLVVALYELEYVHVLRFDASCGVYHEDAHVRVLYRSDRAHHRIEFQVFRHLVLSAYSRGIDEVEVESEFVESCVYGVACRSCDFGHDVTLFAYECVDDAALSGVGSSHYGEAWDAVLYRFALVGGHFREHEVEQVARAASRCRRDALRFTQSERVELRSVVYLVVVVGLVGYEDYG